MSKTISKKQVKHISRLAKLRLTNKEINKFSSQLSDILDYMAKIGQLKIPPSKTARHLDLINIFRPDKIDKSRMLSQKQALSQSKKTHNGYFVVKSIFK